MELNKLQLEELKVLVLNKLDYFNSRLQRLYFESLEYPDDIYIKKQYNKMNERYILFKDVYEKLLNYEGEKK